jgi:cation transport ATPase
MDKDRLKELEIESILEETHYLADQERMEQTAQKYRAKPKIEEIFSNADKKPRLKNTNPLDESEPDTSNSIVGDKTAATMQAELIMDGNDDDLVTPEQLKAEAEKKAAEKAEKAKREYEEAKKKAAEEENKIVTLTPEYDENTEFSGEVLGEVDQFRDEAEIKSYHTIDIDIPEDKPKEKTETKEKKEASQTPVHQFPNTEKPPRKVVAKVPVYRPDEPRNILNVKAGRFSEAVANEYEEYVRSKNPSVIAHVLRPEPTIVDEEIAPTEEKHKDNRPIGEKVISALVGIFSKDESDDNDTVKEENSKPVEDYTGEEDEKSILYELNHNIRKLFMRSLLSGIIAAVVVVLTIVTRIFPSAICSAVPFAPAAYAILLFILMAASLVLNRVAMLSGLSPLVHIKGNSDTAVAVAGAAGMVQIIVSFFCLGDLNGFHVNYYTVIPMLAFFANNVGKLYMVLRVKDNFKFVSSKGQKYASKIYNNESVAMQMMSGTAADRPIIAYQHKTEFPSNFLKISYAPDPSEDLASKLAPITTIASIIIAVMYGVVKLSFADALNAFALITAVSVPVATLLSVNAPVRKLCKTLLSYGSMLSGYPSVKQFCDSTAIMIDANELFPAESISLEGIKTFEDYGIDESLLCGIAILKEAQNPIANAFDSVVAETEETLPEVESVLYEDEIGLVGWIKSERILVGSRTLMEKYSVEVPNMEYEEKYTSQGRQVTYLSRAGRLVAMFVTRYTPDAQLKAEMQRAETNGISFLIRTTDYNVTNDLIAKLYDLFYRSIKVLPTGLGNVLKEAEDTVEETSRSYLITNGKAASLARAVTGCVKIKHNISLSIIIQLIAVIFGLLVASTLSLYAGVQVMGSLEVLIYALFWGAAAVFAPAVQKP